MIIKSLSLQNFRNYPKKSFDFTAKTNLFVGPNAIGKTNILEAIYFLSTGKSFRVKGVEREAILYQQAIARIQAEIENEGQKTKLEIVLTVGEVMGEKTAKKKYLVNQVARRAVDFLGNLRCVYFGPEDLELITDSPGLRRKYLDSVLVQTDREYRRASLSYDKGLRQRNKILEGIREAKDLGYNEQNMRKRLYFWDIQIRNSKFEIRNLSIYGSRGEQRLAILWLKLAELSYLERETQTLPILLLDDIFSELDMEHRELVFDLIKGHQAIITTTDIGMVDKKWFEEVKLVDLEEK